MKMWFALTYAASLSLAGTVLAPEYMVIWVSIACFVLMFSIWTILRLAKSNADSEG